MHLTHPHDDPAPAFEALLPEDYARWRPAYHLIASKGWMNDPCAPGYNPSTRLYHLGFQWNPRSAEWGDIIWGKAFSEDLVAWEVSDVPSMQRDQAYDRVGVFTGCWMPTGLDGKHTRAPDTGGQVSFIYTSVSRGPIHYSKPYYRGCETLSVATSRDGGQTWEKHAGNPILPGPPKGIDVTGWRDPYIAPWPTMQKLLEAGPCNGTNGHASDHKEPLFGVIAGGIRNETPTTFLYRIDPHDLTRWTYIAPLVAPGMNYAPSRWSGDLGVNWEVTNFLPLQSPDSQYRQDFLILGAEGCKAPYGGAGTLPGTKRTSRAQLWVGLDPARGPSSAHGALMDISYGGILDHGLYYAANSFFDPLIQEHVAVGWVTEEDLPVEVTINQGWSGCLSLPRVIYLQTIDHVVRASASELQDITSIKAVPDAGETATFTVQTLGVAPDPRLQKLRRTATKRSLPCCALNWESKSGVRRNVLPLCTAQWEAHAVFSSVSASERLGLVIHHGDASRSRTELYFRPAEETFFVNRPPIHLPPFYKGKDRDTALQSESAPFTLFTTRHPQTGKETEEQLRITLFYDGSVLEVFVNDRVAITTRVYLDKTECSGLEAFVEGDRQGGARLEEATVWDGLSAAAQRCNGSSSPE